MSVFLERLDARLGPWGAAFALALAAQGISFFLYSHPFEFGPDHRWSWTFKYLSEDPFTSKEIGDPWLRHRLLGPALAYLLGLRHGAGFLVWIAANPVQLAIAYVIVRRRLSPVPSALTVLLLATTLVVITSQTWIGFSDSLAYLGIMVCLVRGWPALLGAFMFLGMLADERIVAAIPLILLWHALEDRPEERFRKILFRGTAFAMAVGLWVLYFLWMRRFFPVPADAYVSMKSILTGEYILKHAHYIHAFPGGIYFALRSAWLLPLMLMLRWAQERNSAGLVLLICILAVIGEAGLGEDTSRIGAMAYPAVLLAVVRLGRRNEAQAVQLLTSALALNVFTPQYQVVGSFKMLWPLPVSIGRWYFNF